MSAELSRRALLALGAAVVIGACSGDDDATDPADPTEPTAPPSTAPPSTAVSTTREPSTTATPTTDAPTTTAGPPLAADPFAAGVAAGDPDATSAVLWTRLLGDGLPDEIDVVWELAGDEGFATVTADGHVTASAADGHSVHVTAPVDGPSWYRFRAGGFTSPPGRVAPVDAATSSLRLATASCQHFETGFYAAHRDIAEWAPDAVVFLGDFIYEGASRPVGDGRVRSHDGPEPTDLGAYRARYAQYLSDADLRASRAACPWLVIWDDHEVENNYAGLEPQDPAERDAFPARRAAAYRAWWEHMPVRLPPPVDGADYTTYRTVSLGPLADVILLDGRQHRTDQACGDVTMSLAPPCPDALDPARTMLGGTQESWVGEELAADRAIWTVLGQQTVLSDLRLPTGAILNYDQWDGYGPARDRLLAQAAVAERVVVLTGDIHLAGIGRLPGVGTEFVAASISSNGLDPGMRSVLVGFPAVVDAELAHRGYIRHVVTPETWTAEYRIVDDVAAPDSAVSTWQTFRVDAATPDQPVAI
ncbi:MAG: alkaline phosphatase D family protein [Ilumatobacteraceae bacterium]